MNNSLSQKGFTLIEIMIALLIGLFLTAGAVQIFSSTKQTNRTQENLSRMQENARFAMQFITEDIRKVGFDGATCGSGKMLDQAINNLDLSAATAAHLFDTRIVGSLVLYSSLSGAIAGTDNTGINGSDSVTIRALGSLGAGAPLVAGFPAAKSDDLHISLADAGGFAQGDIVLVTNCFNSDIFEIKNNPVGGVLNHSTGSGHAVENNVDDLSAIYDSGAKVYRLSENTGLSGVTYYIADNVGIPGLRRDTVNQLVPDIENMQILYGQQQASGALFFVPAGTAGLDMNQVMSIRVSLLVRSPDDFVATSPQAYFYNFDGTSTAAADSRLRKVYTSTIAVRNRLN